MANGKRKSHGWRTRAGASAGYEKTGTTVGRFGGRARYKLPLKFKSQSSKVPRSRRIPENRDSLTHMGGYALLRIGI
ncbi:hypothetical protein X777_08246 [Ooceraea biroi]|uniref:Uncharacterized protein n=1 Tax=Ooceraea biroi TaxID=2015173 RepID=A0A026X0W5_OOCBI|nr:hypothetical protein X777_08246 [Ooceraea biroi]